MAIRRTFLLAALAVAVVAGGAGCARVPASPAPAASSVPARLEPGAGLVGLWKVTAESEGDRTWARISPTGIDVNRDGLQLMVGWGTAGDELVAVVVGFDGRLRDISVPWLTEAAAFERSGDGWTLRAAGGRALAVLRPVATAPAPRGAGDRWTPPALDAEGRARLEVPVPAAGGAPVSAAALHGRWVTGAAREDGTPPALTLRADGSLSTTDGCNAAAGRWRLVGGDRLITAQTARTARACPDLVPVPDWVGAARTVALVDGRLRLADARGRPLGELQR